VVPEGQVGSGLGEFMDYNESLRRIARLQNRQLLRLSRTFVAPRYSLLGSVISAEVEDPVCERLTFRSWLPALNCRPRRSRSGTAGRATIGSDPAESRLPVVFTSNVGM
jgi:hypothetical protein